VCARACVDLDLEAEKHHLFVPDIPADPDSRGKIAAREEDPLRNERVNRVTDQMLATEPIAISLLLLDVQAGAALDEVLLPIEQSRGKDG
jgi:hypothetical protein